MYKLILIFSLLGLTSCCSVPVAALDQAISAIGPEYAEYVINDPKYDDSVEGLTEAQRQIRIEQKEIRLENLKLLEELLNELRK